MSTETNKTSFGGARSDTVGSEHSCDGSGITLTSLGSRMPNGGNDSFTCAQRDRASIYLCQGEQGQSGTWAWVGVEDVSLLYEGVQEQRGSHSNDAKEFSMGLRDARRRP
jgi:hypothetical protein